MPRSKKTARRRFTPRPPRVTYDALDDNDATLNEYSKTETEGATG